MGKQERTTSQRRKFLKQVAMSGSIMTLPNLPVFAGPFSFQKNGHLVPEDKKLSPTWIKALYERGQPETYTAKKGQLKHIGMPVGGIACGQLYLGGDGNLWFWHIFKTEYGREKDHNQRMQAMTLGAHYHYPEKIFNRETRPVEHGTAVKVKYQNNTIVRKLDKQSFEDIEFRGEYPIGRVSYNSSDLPIEIQLEAFSPFIPGDLENSSLPATILNYKVKNTINQNVDIDLVGWLENAVCPYSKNKNLGLRRNRVIRDEQRVTIHSTVESVNRSVKPLKEDLVYEDFEHGSYKRWKAKGTSFGNSSVQRGATDYKEKGMRGNYYVSSYNLRNLDGGQNDSSYAWGSITPADEFTGSLTSRSFTVTHDYITFLLGGGYHPQKTAINLIVDGKVVRTATAQNNWQLQERYFDVRDFVGMKAKLQIVDDHKSMWGSISVDHIVFTDRTPAGNVLTEQHGYGTMSYSLLNPEGNVRTVQYIDKGQAPEKIFESLENVTEASGTGAMDERLVGALAESLTLKPGEEKEITFLLTWYFPHLTGQQVESGELMRLHGFEYLKRHYHNWFRSANQVADYVSLNFEKLAGSTMLWNKTYYDSTLPYWLLDRSFIPNNALATNTMLWFDNGRIWGWEGVECCPGTCQHVWQYAQGPSRIFPKMERTLRTVTDLGYSLNEDGSMGHRDETAGHHGLVVAHDGHCGTIMRILREHKMSPDNQFLKSNYEKIKQTVEFIIEEDKDKDGLLEGRQTNTLDASWYGPMGWISSLYLGALAAGKQMAAEVGDMEFADKCDSLLEIGKKNLVENLFNDEYFIHLHDREKYPKVISSNDGCHIDQVLGQSFGHQIGIKDRIVPQEEAVKSLESIWKYNFAPDAFAYQAKHKAIKGVRIYASEGEAGTIMTTWPKSDGDTYAVPGMSERPDNSPLWEGPGGYFDEVWPGQEYQLATHMIYEGLLEKGLATAKVVHDRFNPIKRNPYNEIECSDHYSRSMASYGLLIAVSGFDYHGPNGYLSFSPKLDPEAFKAPFTAAQGWGTLNQQITNFAQINSLELKFGQLRLSKLALEGETLIKASSFKLSLNGNEVEAETSIEGNNLIWTFDAIVLRAGDELVSEVKRV